MSLCPTRSTSFTKASPETTKRMKSVKRRDTGPEMVVRRLLHRLGARFRVCSGNLPGRPDIANKSRGWCVFVHGCFWHGHAACKFARLPRANNRWWTEKISANKKRDALKEAALQEMGFHVLVIWQCELANEAETQRRLKAFVATARQEASKQLKPSSGRGRLQFSLTAATVSAGRSHSGVRPK